MTIQEFVDEAQIVFEKNSTTEKAPQMKAYMKDQFEYLGLSRPERNVLQKELFPKFVVKDSKTLELLVKKLWKLPHREFQYLALDIISKNKKMIPELNFEFFNFLLENKAWWDSVDGICSNVVGAYYLAHPNDYKKEMKVWYQSDDFWKRRAAIIFQLNYKVKTDLKFLEERILENNESKEFFLQKAIGWSLRQYSKTDPKWVKSFVKKHPLKPLSKREALRLMDL